MSHRPLPVRFEEYRGDSATSHVIFAVNVPDAPQIAQKMLASEVLGSLGGRLASEVLRGRISLTDAGAISLRWGRIRSTEVICSMCTTGRGWIRWVFSGNTWVDGRARPR